MFFCDKMEKVHMTRADWTLIFCVFAAAAGTALFFLQGGRIGQERVAVVEQDGQEVYRLPLGEETAVEVFWEDGCNVVSVDGRGVWISYADCPDRICVRQGKIFGGGQSIVCLPHRLVVYLEGAAGEETLDAMTD